MRPQIFLGAVVEYKGSLSIQFKKSDGTAINSTAYSLSATSYARKQTIYFDLPVTDTDLNWSLTDYSDSGDLVFDVTFISQPLDAGEPKLFQYVKVNHTTAITVEVLDSAGSSKGKYKLPANPTNQTIFAIKEPFFDNYAILKKDGSQGFDTLKGYQFITQDQLGTDLKLFTGAIVEYNNTTESTADTFTINFKTTDGNSVLASAHTLSKSGRNIDFIYFDEPVKDTDLIWDITMTDAGTKDYDFVSKVTYLSIPITQLTQDGTKHLFTHLEVEHTVSATVTVYDSSDSDGGYLSSKELPANSSGKTLIALQNPFVDYYGYVKVESGSISAARLIKMDANEGA